MDIDALKNVLGQEQYDSLKRYIDDLIGQRDAARKESIEGRKSLKAKVEELQQSQAALLERLGIESLDELDKLPDVKGQAEAAKQVEARIKRLERQLAEEAAKAKEIEGRYRESRKAAAIAAALSGHDFIARDLVESYISSSVVWEGDDLLYRTPEGTLVPVADGVAGLAKSRPELVRPSGTGGAGVARPEAGGQRRQMSRAEFESLPPQQRMEAAKAGVQII